LCSRYYQSVKKSLTLLKNDNLSRYYNKGYGWETNYGINYQLIDFHTELQNWAKKSIFFKLLHRSTLKLRHNLDVMHIEKNICDSVLGTLLNIDGKMKDTANAQRDLCEMGICRKLHLRTNGLRFSEWFKGVKFPNGYASNISRRVNKLFNKIYEMKSHDCHVFL
jgi:hypothetical protein